jgi:acetylornithine/succinyldiaminopimelate/putrescine aminotransferase
MGLEKKFLAWSNEPEDIEIVDSSGSLLRDAKGKEYIDFIMGWCVGNFGWGNTEIISAIKEFSGPAYVYPAFQYKGWAELSELLADMAPGDLTKCFRATGGTDAIETAMKIAMIYTGRTHFLSVEGTYHGNSIGALSIGSSHNTETYSNLLPHCYKIVKPLDENAIESVERALAEETYAALIMEPVLTHPEIHVPSKEFVQAVRGLCDKHGTLLIFDEVAVGFGRTGSTFACEHFNVEPDVLCLAKALSGGYAAIGTAITTKEIGDAVQDEIHAYPTYGWHPLSTHVALASLKYFSAQKEELFRNIANLSALFDLRFQKMKFSDPFEVNMIGMAISVNVGSNAYAKKIAEKCLDKGLMIEYNETNLMMFPSLDMSSEIANKGLDILEACI